MGPHIPVTENNIMPIWTCPNCHADNRVAIATLATMHPCPNCGVIGRVVQSSAKPPRAAPTDDSPQDAIDAIRVDAPLLVKLYRVVSLVGAVAVILLTILVCANAKSVPLLMLLPIPLALLWLALVWLVTDFMSDVYRCRRLLEEIAKK